MAYVLGYLYADGCVMDARSSRAQYMMVISKDRGSIELIKRLLNSEHPILIREPYEARHRDNKIYQSSQSYILRIGSKEIYKDLCVFGLHPNKSKSILFPSIPAKSLPDFIRGYFDGDGCVHVEIGEGVNGKKTLKRLRAIFTSGSYKFLEELAGVLTNKVLVKRRKIYRSQRAFQLRYSTTDSISLFKFLYRDTPHNLMLKRKFEVFARYFSLRPQRIDKNVQNILNSYKDCGLVAKRQTQWSAKPLYMGSTPI